MIHGQAIPRGLPEEIETGRLRLRRASVTDAETVFRTYARDPEVSRFVLFRPDQTLEDVRQFLDRAETAWDAGTGATWAIILKDSRELIGMIDLRVGAEANLGYVLARQFWNRGLTTEAVRAVIASAFSQPEVRAVWAVCEVNNTASARVMEKAGMVFEARLERHLVFPNLGEEPRDVLKYSIAREQWNL